MHGKLNRDGTLSSCSFKRVGFSLLTQFEKDSNGNFVEFYLEPDSNNFHKIDALKILKKSNNQYEIDRKKEYQKLNQDELRFDDLENNTTTWQDSIRAIKLRFPK